MSASLVGVWPTCSRLSSVVFPPATISGGDVPKHPSRLPHCLFVSRAIAELRWPVVQVLGDIINVDARASVD